MPHKEIRNTDKTSITLLNGDLLCVAGKQVPVTEKQLDAIDGKRGHLRRFEDGTLVLLDVDDVEDIRAAEAHAADVRRDKENAAALKARDPKVQAERKSRMEARAAKAEQKDEKASGGGRGKAK